MSTITGAPKTHLWRTSVDDDNVIPFRKRPPSDGEIEAYRQVTRNWSSQLRQLMFPEHFKHDQDEGERSG
jgi:hypothetical protein